MHIRQYLDENNYKDVKWYFDLPYQTKENLNSLYLPLLNLKQLQSYFASIETNLYIYKYKNPLVKLFKRVCIRVISDNHIPLWFGKRIPPQISESNRLLYRKNKLGVKNLNLLLHPLG